MILWYFPWAPSPHAWPLQCTHVMFLLVPHHSIFNTWQTPHYNESSSFVILTQFAHQPFHPGIAHTWIQLAMSLCNIWSHWVSRLELVKWCSSFADLYQQKLCMHVHTSYSPYNIHNGIFISVQDSWVLKSSKLLPQSTPRRVVARNMTWLIYQQVWVTKAKIEGNSKGLTLMWSC